MSVKLLLNPAAEARECIHPGTGVKFMIRPINPVKYGEIFKASVDAEGKIYPPKKGELIAVAAIAGWGDEVGDKNGPLPCTEENLRTFGLNRALDIMIWVEYEATSLDHFRVEEEKAAKKD